MLREERNLKQEDIANLLHVEIAAISKYETGRVPLKEEYIKILSNFFDVSSDYLLGLTDFRNNQNKNIEQPNDEWLYAFNNGYNDLEEADKEVLKATFDAYLKARKGEK
jgi:transcriptional regulator with XRE-family HTH domain